MTFTVATRTDSGQVRDVNEDAVYADTDGDWGMLVIADGMGGHAAGDVASEAAIEAFVETIEPAVSDGLPEDLPSLLTDSVYAANDRLDTMIEQEPELDGMGTTLVAALLTDGQATLVNVGDSRGYLVTESDIEQITADHSLVQQLVENGDITPQEARTHPQRNIVSQSLGTHEAIDPDVFTINRRGSVLLCSDGLTEELSDEEIRTLVAHADNLDETADRLVQRANENGGSDNISVAIGQRLTSI